MSKPNPVILGASAGTLTEFVVGERENAHPLVGMFCHKTSTNPETTKYGWNFNFQCHVHAVLGDVALMQFYSAVDGFATDIKPVPLAELLSGAWVFYPDADAWREAGSEARENYFRYARAERDRIRAEEDAAGWRSRYPQ